MTATTDSVALGAKEIVALQRLVERFGDETTRLYVLEYRDAADVGWLRVMIHVPRERGNWSRPQEPRVFKVSPLGHVYDWNSMAVVFRAEDDDVREEA